MLDLLLLTPPLLQPNTPYPATPVLTRQLRRDGFQVAQRDLSLELTLRLLTPEFLGRAAADISPLALRDHDDVKFFHDNVLDYQRTVLPVLDFLRGRRPELAWRIASRNFLPEGPYFAELDEEEQGDSLDTRFGPDGVSDCAKYLASLYLDDLSSYLTHAVDADFTLGRYAEQLAVSLPSLTPLLERLKPNRETAIDRELDQLGEETIKSLPALPRFVGFAIPFPGTLYASLRLARLFRRLAPECQIVFGGGYVSSELREIQDSRIFDFADYLLFDEGVTPLRSLLQGKLSPAPSSCQGCGNTRLLSRHGWMQHEVAGPAPSLLVPDYDGLPLDMYFSVLENSNPMHRLWTDGTWLKLQLCQGCYWHKCAFCDLSLDYIGRYVPSRPTDIVDAMEELMQKTGRSGFHFVDEALAPALLKQVCQEILRRRLTLSWWGNIRFDQAFDHELADLMSQAGCIAVTGGLECANDRLLKLMRKGITLESATKALQAFADNGILVHAYLMYGFPSETADEALDALDFVRRCFAERLLQSAFWHRFALTAHSDIAAHPEKYGVTILERQPNGPLFAKNEIPFTEAHAPNWDKLGKVLKTALYNFMQGQGLDIPARKWLKMLKS